MTRRWVLAVVAVVVVVAGSAMLVDPQVSRSEDTRDLSFRVLEYHESPMNKPGDDCTIFAADPQMQGASAQLEIRNAEGTMVALYGLSGGKMDDKKSCVMEFTITAPDSPFYTVYLDGEHMYSLSRDQLPLEQPLVIWAHWKSPF